VPASSPYAVDPDPVAAVKVLQKIVSADRHDLRVVSARVEMIDADIAIRVSSQDATRPRKFPDPTRAGTAD
jgi:hypothetical protein